jgi:formylglycine-generating enzyme
MKEGILIVCVAVVVAGLGSSARARVNIETVPLGDVGNSADTRYETPGYGAVDYQYSIGKYEVTAGQYCEFLNAVAATDTYGLYNSNMNGGQRYYGCRITQNGENGEYTYDFSGGTVVAPGSTAADWADRPVNYVSVSEALRFANWLTNGQPGLDGPSVPQDSNSTESGSYTLNGAITDEAIMAVSVPDATQRATWASGSQPYYLLTSGDEWYKAAYYDPSLNGGAGGYFDYPTSTNSAPSGDLTTPDDGNNATFFDSDYTIGSPYYRTEVGAHENSDSPYGTFDQGGNVWELNDTLAARGSSGGAYRDSGGGHVWTHLGSSQSPVSGASTRGFRVSRVPEPATLTLLTLGGLALVRRRRNCK